MTPLEIIATDNLCKYVVAARELDDANRTIGALRAKLKEAEDHIEGLCDEIHCSYIPWGER